jgi:hypothetical protein
MAGLSVNIMFCVPNSVLCWQTGFVSKIRHIAKRKTVVFHTEKSQPHKQHIWFFADTKANAEKTKRA